MKYALSLVAIVSACGTPAPALQPAPNADAGADVGTDANTPVAVDDISATLEPLRAKGDVPAMSAAVWRGKLLVASGVVGVRKFGDTTLATTSDKWHLGSNTKAMTSTLIGKYVDSGKLHFDDAISKLFAGEKIDPGYADVTLLQLLQHRSGAPANPPNDIWSQMRSAGTDQDALKKAVLAVLARPPAGAKGTYVYSNTGYMIAGAALELAAGNSWETLMTGELFTPLGMTSCGFGAPGDPTQVDQPWGHDVVSNKAVGQKPTASADNPRALGPAGTVHCALDDWGKFLNVHLAGARGEAVSLLSPATMTQLHTPPKGGDYAAGWVVEKDGTTFWHNGSNTMWYAKNRIIPTQNLVVTVASNLYSDGSEQAVEDAIVELSKKYAQ